MFTHFKKGGLQTAVSHSLMSTKKTMNNISIHHGYTGYHIVGTGNMNFSNIITVMSKSSEREKVIKKKKWIVAQNSCTKEPPKQLLNHQNNCLTFVKDHHWEKAKWINSWLYKHIY